MFVNCFLARNSMVPKNLLSFLLFKKTPWDLTWSKVTFFKCEYSRINMVHKPTLRLSCMWYTSNTPHIVMTSNCLRPFAIGKTSGEKVQLIPVAQHKDNLKNWQALSKLKFRHFLFLSYTDTPFVLMNGQGTIFCIPTSPSLVTAWFLGIMPGTLVMHSLQKQNKYIQVCTQKIYWLTMGARNCKIFWKSLHNVSIIYKDKLKNC